MIRRREFIARLGGAAIWPVAARAQQRGKVATVGFLGTGTVRGAQRDGWPARGAQDPAAAPAGCRAAGRALADDEVVKVWRAAEALQHRAMRGEAVSGGFGGLVMLSLLSGLRRAASWPNSSTSATC